VSYTYTPETIARVCHEANRALQAIQADPGIPVAEPWEDFDGKPGVIAGVLAVLEDGATPEHLHDSWCARKLTDGWVYGPVKDPAAKTHPCLVEYRDLPEEQRRKDVLFEAIVTALSDPAPGTAAPETGTGVTRWRPRLALGRHSRMVRREPGQVPGRRPRHADRADRARH